MQRSAKSFFKRLKRPALISLTLIAPFMIIDLHGGAGAAGVLTTAAGLTFTGDSANNALALRTSDGTTLWHSGTGRMGNSPITYELDGGKPNLRAPAPRLPDGRPDFSGIWQSARKIPCTKEFVECGTEIGGSPLALNIGADMPGGLPYQQWAAALVKQRTADNSKDDPHVRCLPDNPPRPYGLPHMTKAVHAPRLLVLLNEVNATYRQIFIDGRAFPNDPNPSWNGYSVAAWEGDTLVVETIGFRDDLWLDMSGSPMTDAARMTERFRRPNYGTLEIQITIDDSKAYTRPWTVEMPQKITLDTELIDEFCLENEKSYQRMQRSR